jgi:hypothetical protein
MTDQFLLISYSTDTDGLAAPRLISHFDLLSQTVRLQKDNEQTVQHRAICIVAGDMNST